MARKQSWVKSMGNALAMATNMAVAIAAGLFGGRFLDKRLGTGNTMTLIGVLLGVAVGLKIMYDYAAGTRGAKPFGGPEEVEEEGAAKPGPSQQAIESLQAAKERLKELQPEIAKIRVRAEEDAGEGPEGEPGEGEEPR
ncbi:MAG: AtpZ/AtpI family protein [Syntrophomonadaceae bacterium]|jgi:hypothetical protein|nr:AtpZ/AtpI family protein [Syntrophomonadaceae bacterium]MDH7497524.1 AtpZ/AtpI family protein [Syntrophomonadaceae bacterium]